MKNNNKIFTLVELLVVISIIIILCSMLLPALKNVKNKASSIVCSNNIKQMSTGMFSYLGDSNSWMPVLGSWDGVNRWSYVLTSNNYCSEKSFKCPANSDSSLKPIAIGIRLLWNSTNIDNGVNTTKITKTSRQVLFADAIAYENVKRGSCFTNPVTHFQFRHFNNTAMAFLDGHVSLISRTKAINSTEVNLY